VLDMEVDGYNIKTCDLFRSPGVVRAVECRRL